jgi:hypothetical protein
MLISVGPYFVADRHRRRDRVGAANSANARSSRESRFFDELLWATFARRYHWVAGRDQRSRPRRSLAPAVFAAAPKLVVDFEELHRGIILEGEFRIYKHVGTG